MIDRGSELAAIVDTLIEGQAQLAGSIYIDLVNQGLLCSEAAASRLRFLSTLAANPLQRHAGVAAALSRRLEDYATALEQSCEVGSTGARDLPPEPASAARRASAPAG